MLCELHRGDDDLSIDPRTNSEVDRALIRLKCAGLGSLKVTMKSASSQGLVADIGGGLSLAGSRAGLPTGLSQILVKHGAGNMG